MAYKYDKDFRMIYLTETESRVLRELLEGPRPLHDQIPRDIRELRKLGFVEIHGQRTMDDPEGIAAYITDRGCSFLEFKKHERQKEGVFLVIATGLLITLAFALIRTLWF